MPKGITKPAKTFIMVWPAIMLANKRIDKLIGRERYERTSIGTNTGAINIGIPEGKKKLKKCKPWRAIAITVTPRNTTRAIAKVTTMWLVKVNA